MENANFSAENMAFIRCFKDYADAGDAYMAEQAAAAEAASKAAEEQVSAGEDALTNAYVAPVVIEGQQTPEEQIAATKKELTKITQLIKKEKDDSVKQTLVAEQIQIASRLKFL